MAQETKRHLPVLGGSVGDDAPPPSGLYVVLVSSAATLFSWTLLAALVNGLLVRGPSHAGVGAAANLVALFVTAAGGGAIAIVLDRRSPARRARYAGLVAAAIGWSVAFAFTLTVRMPLGTELPTWIALLVVLGLVAAVGANAGHSLAAKRSATRSS